MRIRANLFSKIYLVIFTSGLVIALSLAALVFLNFRGGRADRGDFFNDLTRFYRRNVSYLSLPPTPEEGRELSDRLGVGVYYFGVRDSWQTDSTPEGDRLAVDASLSGTETGGIRGGKVYIGFPQDGGYYFFYGNLLFNFSRLPLLGGLILLAAVLTLLVTSRVLTYLLTPIVELEKGMASLKRGDFSYRIEPRSKDELGRLSEGFNLMSRNLKADIQLKEQLLLDVGHELKTPLTRMRLTLEFISDEAGGASLREDLDEMEYKIQTLLTSYRLESPYGRPVKSTIPVRVFLRELIRPYGGTSPGIDLRVDASYRVEADPELFRTVCRNILENGLTYSSQTDRPLIIDVTHGDGRDWLTFTDFGPGIPPAYRNRVFEPFFRLDPSREKSGGGSGLGLFLCRKIMDAHGGEISLGENREGGTVVSLFLPEN